MPFLERQSLKLHYQVFGERAANLPGHDKVPVLLLHGFSGSIEQWRMAGMIEALQVDHTVIAIDLRGHGQSSKPRSPQQYGLQQRLHDIVEMLEHLHIPRVHLVGYSMGGWLGFGMMTQVPQMIASLCVGGSHPFHDSMAAFRQVQKDQPDTFIKAFESFIGEPLSTPAKAMIVQNDLQALTAAAQDREDMSNVIPSLNSIPVMLFCGELDQRLSAMKTLAQQLTLPLLVLPRVGHALAPFAGPALTSAVKAFLVNVSATQTSSF